MAYVVSTVDSNNVLIGGAATDLRGRVGNNEGFGRHGVVAAVRQVFETGAASGAIIVGEYGVGKTFVARQVVESIAHDSLILSLRCSPITATMQYGALSPVLNELGDISLDNPLSVLRDVSKSLKERGKGRRVVFFVDNIQSLDDHSAMIITQLAASGTAKILAACDSLSSAPSEIIGLWRDGLMRRVDLTTFSETETRCWLGHMLGAPVSAAAARALWTVGGGNPRYLEVVLQEQLEAETLVRRDGVWAVTGAPFVCGHNSIDTVMTAFGAIAPGERQVAELLALSGGLPLNTLMKICDVSDIDALQQRGYLVISHAESAMVRLANRLMAQVLREHVPNGRSRSLYQMAVSLSNVEESVDASDFDMVAWALDCGVPLELNRAINASKKASKMGFPDEALRILNSLGRPHHAVASLETARALISMGETARARSVAFGAGLDTRELSLSEWTELMLMRNALSTGLSEVDGATDSLLDQIRLRLDSGDLGDEGSADAVQEGELEILQQDLLMGIIEERMHSGRYHEVAADLELLFINGLEETTRRRAGNWLLGAWILTGRVDDAFNLAEKIGFQKLVEGLSSGEPRLSDSALLFAVVASLAADDTDGTDEWVPAGVFIVARSTAFAELSEGLVHAYNGRADRALEYLVPAAIQLTLLKESGAGALASAAAGYAYALKGEDDSALHHLNKKYVVENSSRIIKVGIAYFNTMATAEMASKEKSIVRLLSLAENERQFRTCLVEMVLLQAAVRLGGISSAKRLEVVAGAVQGSLARICECYGQGMKAGDVAGLLRVAEAAANIGDDLLSRDVARAALKIANDSLDKDGRRQAQQLIRGGVLKLGHVKVSSEDGQVLTQREQEIASHAAAGDSNKAIAARMHISVRTVEGHLYQVYAKLQVTSRAELREVLA